MTHRSLKLRLFASLPFIINAFGLCAQDAREDQLIDSINAALVIPRGGFIAPVVLNAFFSHQVSRYLSTSGDLTISKGFAVLDNADDRLAIGGQLALGKGITGYTRWVASAAFKADIKKGFSTVFKNGDEQSDLGVVLKLTHIWRAMLRNGTFGTQEQHVRENGICAATELQGALARKTAKAWSEAERTARGITGLMVDTMAYHEQSRKLINELASAAAKEIAEKKYYRTSHAWWVSTEAFVPFSQTNYYTVDSVTAALWDTHELRAIEAKISPTYLYTNRYLGTTFLTAWFGYLNNNNILSKQLTTSAASSNASNNMGDTLALVQLDSKSDVGIGQYARFDTYKVGGRLVWMFRSWMGVSGEFEKWPGDYEPLNWKLGVPFALNNEKGERVINFELQWREQLGVHSLGLSVGLPFGGSLYR